MRRMARGPVTPCPARASPSHRGVELPRFDALDERVPLVVGEYQCRAAVRVLGVTHSHRTAGHPPNLDTVADAAEAADPVVDHDGLSFSGEYGAHGSG